MFLLRFSCFSVLKFLCVSFAVSVSPVPLLCVSPLVLSFFAYLTDVLSRLIVCECLLCFYASSWFMCLCLVVYVLYLYIMIFMFLLNISAFLLHYSCDSISVSLPMGFLSLSHVFVILFFIDFNPWVYYLCIYLCLSLWFLCLWTHGFFDLRDHVTISISWFESMSLMLLSHLIVPVCLMVSSLPPHVLLSFL